MIKNKKLQTFFYFDKPIFGLDIGFSSLKVMQIAKKGHKQTVTGYGIMPFDRSAIKNGVIVDHQKMAESAHDLFQNGLVGEITTRRAVLSIPASRTFNRTLSLPVLKKQDVADAVRLEAEQYIPVPIDQLYMDYSVISETDKGIEVLAVAAPKQLVDSHLELASILGLDVVAVESTIGAASRLYVRAEHDGIPTVLIDLGSQYSDITIFDKAPVVTGTVSGGGDSFTEMIAKKFGITHTEAHFIKTDQGLGLSENQKKISESLQQPLEQLVKEIKRMIRYYEERNSGHHKIGQVVTMGGGATIPGLSEYLTNVLRLPVRMCYPWSQLEFDSIKQPSDIEKSTYITVAGLALIKPKEIFT